MPALTAPDPNYAERVRASFARQQVMSLIGATIAGVRPGVVEIHLPFRAGLTQQHGFLHAGIVTTICDSACGYAALSLMAPGSGVLTVEYKVNLLAPAAGDTFIARGEVTKAGRALLFCQGEVRAYQAESEDESQPARERDGRDEATRVEPREPRLVATMMATMMRIEGRAGITD